MRSLEDCFEAYRVSLVSRAKKPGAIRTLDSQARALLGHFGSTFPAMELTVLKLEAWQAQRLQEVSIETVNGALGALRSALRYAVLAELIPSMPVQVRLLHAPRREPRVLTRAQVAQLLDRAPSPFEMMIRLAAKTGMRHQEILHLQVGDVDFGRATLRVSSKPEVRWTPKNHEERSVPFSQQLAGHLRPFICTHTGGQPRSWLFPSPQEGGLPRAHAFTAIRGVFQAAGLYQRDARPGLHQLRRTWATELLGGGTDLKTVQRMGGWADLVTLQRYVTTSDERSRAAIELLDDMPLPAPPGGTP